MRHRHFSVGFSVTEAFIVALLLFITTWVTTFGPIPIQAAWTMATEEQRRLAATNLANSVAPIIEALRGNWEGNTPTLRMDMPDYYEGQPDLIANWLRSMAVYLRMVKVKDVTRMTVIALQRI